MVTQPEDSVSRKFIDNTAMLYAARFGMPILGFLMMTALSVIGYLINNAVGDIKKGQETAIVEFHSGQQQVWSRLDKVNETLASTNNVQYGLVATVNGVKQQVDHLQMQVDTLPRK
jgi:hypothetical protein